MNFSFLLKGKGLLATAVVAAATLPTALAASDDPSSSARRLLRADAGHRKLAKPNAPDCDVVATALLEIPGDGAKLEDDVDLLCIMHPSDANGKSNQGRRIKGDDATMKKLKAMLNDGEIVSGESTLQLDSDVGVSPSDLVLPPNFDAKNKVKKNGREGQNPGQGNSKKNKNGRRLNVVGEKPMLVVKVTDGGGLARPESVDQISDDIFGTYGDPVNLKSQLDDCSMGKMTVIAGDNGAVDENGDPKVDQSLYVAPGVMEVNVTSSLTDTGRYTMHDEVTAAVEAMIGFTLPGPYQQVLYIMEGCYVGCGYAAYAYINSWMSVYQGPYFYQVGVLVHELGHNFGLAHSGEGGATYTDHTGMMGNPLYSDDVGKMCYNGAKNWQIGWYDDRKRLLEPLADPSSFSHTETIVGIADYLNNPDNRKVVIKLETGTGADYFVAFNRATGVNSQNDQGDDMVTITQVDGNHGDSYSQSWRRALLGAGGQHTIASFGGSNYGLVVEVTNIDLTSAPGTATVQFSMGTLAPTPSPTTGTPTPAPTPAPQVPTTSSPTGTPTPAPTLAPQLPTTGSPTATATPPPTPAPVTSNPTFTPGTTFALETNPSCSSTGGAGGIWFDVLAKNSLTVTSLAFETQWPGTATVSVYTKTGTHVGSEQNPNAWTLLATAPEVTLLHRRPGGAWPPISTHLPESLFSQLIAAGDRRAFYIHIEGSYLTYGANFNGNAAVGALQKEDANIQQFVGSTEGGGGLFGGMNTVKLFNGFIKYTMGSLEADPTPAPTPAPTPNPTVAVTPNPTPNPVGPSLCPADEVSIEVDILTDDWPQETNWTLTNTCTGVQVAASPSYTTQRAYSSHSYCLPEAEYKFNITDTFADGIVFKNSTGDGICCSYGPGSYTVRSNGAQVATGGMFASSESKTFGKCITLSPSASPSSSPTPSPTKEPTEVPTNLPTASPTPKPTDSPTESPTKVPTDFPTLSPTSEPSVSIAPTPFEPEIVELFKREGSNYIVRAAYFEVQGGSDVWAKITNLKILTYNTKHLEVYMKYGSAEGYEATPCSWKKVAETAPTWNGGSWQERYPDWVNGFDPVVLPPNQKVSFYIVNMNGGMLGAPHSNSNKYHMPWSALPATSPVGAVSMSYGKRGYENQRFKPYSSGGYYIHGGLKLETMQPGVTQSPTPSPTEPYTPGIIESAIVGTTAQSVEFPGLQFDVENLGSEDAIINKFSVLFASSGTKSIEIWSRDGSHRGTDESGCDNWNNWCNAWTKVAEGNVFSVDSETPTDTPTFMTIAKAAGTTSFAIVSGDAFLLTEPAANANDIIADNGLLRINAASPIEDHHGNSVQTTHALSTTAYVFQGAIDYDIAHSLCAVQSKASWVVMDPGVGAITMGDIDADVAQLEEIHESVLCHADDPNCNMESTN